MIPATVRLFQGFNIYNDRGLVDFTVGKIITVGAKQMKPGFLNINPGPYIGVGLLAETIPKKFVLYTCNVAYLV